MIIVLTGGIGSGKSTAAGILSDTYGFPVANLIRTKWAADVVYFIMKPLEWIFLIVIYLCDVSPENRIAVQYLPKKKEKL